MDKETIDYIINYYSHLLTFKEKVALKHFHVTLKADNMSNPALKVKVLERWGSKDKDVSDLLNNGFEHFKLTCAENILREHMSEVFINKCPQCFRLARTPFAKQCRHCSFDWH